jgi:hypothetical protein
MARKKKEANEYSGKNGREGDLIDKFQLNRITEYQTPLMQAWLHAPAALLEPHEQRNFDDIFKLAVKSVQSWNEEDLKMKFLAPTLRLGQFTDDEKGIGFYDRIISATVENIPLTVKSDFMYASGTFDVFRTPYFHFQEYKPHKNPSGDSMASHDLPLGLRYIHQSLKKNVPDAKKNPIYAPTRRQFQRLIFQCRRFAR